ncbi:hypothetical protein GCM10027040_36270 [Halomonas shantousis]
MQMRVPAVALVGDLIREHSALSLAELRIATTLPEILTAAVL